MRGEPALRDGPARAGANLRPQVRGLRHDHGPGLPACGAHKSPVLARDFLRVDGHALRARLSVCSTCERAYYCSRPCQLAHWGAHQRACVAPPAEGRRAVTIAYHDLGPTPPQAAIDAAVAQFHERAGRGLCGVDNPVPSFLNAAGMRVSC